MSHVRTKIRNVQCTSQLSTFLTNRMSSLSKNMNSKMESQKNSKRPTCPNCTKPLFLCLCTRLKTPNLDNKVHVTILQHSLEKKHPLNSAKIAKLGLKNVDVFAVTDVMFEAQFEIQPLGLDDVLTSLGEECTSSVCGNASEKLDKTSRKLDQFNTEMYSICDNIITSKDANKGKNKAWLSVTIGKYGEISCISHQWKLQDEGETPKLEHLIAIPEALELLAGGFVVKKLQNKQKSGSIELEQFVEFEITVPPGSVLLFPAQKAVPVEAADFEVKNLIVLDGTWAKANRMYNENPWLRILPSVRLDVEKMSLFSEVRHQPKPGYLSTIESIVYALEALQRSKNLVGLSNLLDVFESMIEDQRRLKDERLNKLSSCDAA